MREVRKRERFRFHVGKYSGQRARDKKDIVICSHAADIPVSLSSAPQETTYMIYPDFI